MRLELGAGASPLVCGFSPLHQTLCEQLSELEQTEATVLYSSGFAACGSVMSTLPEAGDLILSDRLNHASLIDGCRLSKAERYIYPNRDVAAVKSLLEANRTRFRRCYLATDAIFSMDGTRAPLAALCDLADRYDMIMVVDEAHATGVLGTHGGGLCDQLSLQHRVPIRIGTLSKAIGAQGGFVTGPQAVIDYLVQRSRSLIYSTAAPPILISAAIHGLRIIREEPQRRQHLQEMTEALRTLLVEQKLKVVSDQTPILAVILNDARRAVEASRGLADLGYFVPAIRPPTVPEKTSRLRISVSSIHSAGDIEQLAESIAGLTGRR